MGKLAESLNRLPAGSRLYRLQTRPQLLAQSGQAERLFELLTDFDFIEAKVSHPDIKIQELIEDYDRAFEPKVLISGEKAETLKLIQGAIRLSAHLLDKDKTQLAEQLLGRLMSFKAPEILALLAQSKQKQKPWLRPFTSSLTPPGTPLRRTLTGHSSPVLAVAITPNGQQMVSALWDNTLKVWDLESGTEQFTLTGHSHSVRAVTITPNGQQVVSASDDNTLKVWDLHSGAEQFTLTGHSDSVWAVVITPDGQQMVSASRDNTLKVWDLESGAEQFTLTGHSDWVEAVAITPDGKQMVSASWDNTLKVWDLESGAEQFTLTGHSNVVRAVAITPDGQQVVSASWDKTIKVWNLHSGAERLTLTGHSDWIMAVAITPDGKQVVSASKDNTLNLWDLESGMEIASFSGDGALYCCAVAPDGVTIVAGEASGRVHFLRLEGV